MFDALSLCLIMFIVSTLFCIKLMYFSIVSIWCEIFELFCCGNKKMENLFQMSSGKLDVNLTDEIRLKKNYT